jgi:hypothetical protein
VLPQGRRFDLLINPSVPAVKSDVLAHEYRTPEALRILEGVSCWMVVFRSALRPIRFRSQAAVTRGKAKSPRCGHQPTLTALHGKSTMVPVLALSINAGGAVASAGREGRMLPKADRKP